HRAGRRGQHTARGVLEALAGSQGRLLAHHAVAAHLLLVAVAVGDDPVARAQLQRLGAFVGDGHVVGEYIVVLARHRLFRDILALDGDADAPGDGARHGRTLP